MHLSTFVAALLGSSVVAALQNPHKRAPLKPKRSLAISHEAKNPHQKRQSSYATPKTASKSIRSSRAWDRSLTDVKNSQ